MLKKKKKQNEKDTKEEEDAAPFSSATKQNDDDSVLDADVLGLLRSLDDIPADKKRRLTITNNNNNGNEALEETPRCQGYMYKQGHHWHSWKRRWFVLRLSCLNYYRRRQNKGGGSQIPQGTIPLNKITALQRDVGKFPQPFCFQLVITGEGRNCLTIVFLCCIFENDFDDQGRTLTVDTLLLLLLVVVVLFAQTVCWRFSVNPKRRWNGGWKRFKK